MHYTKLRPLSDHAILPLVSKRSMLPGLPHFLPRQPTRRYENPKPVGGYPSPRDFLVLPDKIISLYKKAFDLLISIRYT